MHIALIRKADIKNTIQDLKIRIKQQESRLSSMQTKIGSYTAREEEFSNIKNTLENELAELKQQLVLLKKFQALKNKNDIEANIVYQQLKIWGLEGIGVLDVACHKLTNEVFKNGSISSDLSVLKIDELIAQQTSLITHKKDNPSPMTLLSRQKVIEELHLLRNLFEQAEKTLNINMEKIPFQLISHAKLTDKIITTLQNKNKITKNNEIKNRLSTLISSIKLDELNSTNLLALANNTGHKILFPEDVILVLELSKLSKYMAAIEEGKIPQIEFNALKFEILRQDEANSILSINKSKEKAKQFLTETILNLFKVAPHEFNSHIFILLADNFRKNNNLSNKIIIQELLTLSKIILKAERGRGLLNLRKDILKLKFLSKNEECLSKILIALKAKDESARQGMTVSMRDGQSISLYQFFKVNSSATRPANETQHQNTLEKDETLSESQEQNTSTPN